MRSDLRHESSRMSRRQLLRAGLGGIGIIGLLSAACAPAAPQTAPAPTTAPAAAPTTAPAAAKPTAASTTAAAPRGGELVVAGAGDIKFDPYFNIDALTHIDNQIYNALFDYRGQDPYKPNPQLAESFQEEEKTLTVKLRQGVKFHNGRELVAQDVVDNIVRAKDKSIGHYLFDSFDGSVDSAEATDKYTVRINYKTIYPVKMDDLAALYLIPKEAMADIGSKGVGSGPFKFGSYAPGDKLEMVRFDDYWEKGKPTLDKVTVKVLPDPQAQIANLQAGSLHLVPKLQLPDIQRLKSSDSIQVMTTPPGTTYYVNVVNLSKPPFDNKMVRQALSYSVDRAKINKLAYFDLAPVTQTRYLPTQSWFDEKANTMYTFDLQKAKSLLEQGGQPNGFETTIAVNEAVLPGSKAMAQIWAQDLGKIGVQMKIVEKEQAPFYDEYFKGNYDIQAYGIGDGKLDPATDIAQSSPLRLANNRAHIETQPFFEKYKELVAQGVSSIDPKVRKPVYDQIQEMINDESWIIITGFWVSGAGVSKRVKGLVYEITTFPYYGNVSLEA